MFDAKIETLLEVISAGSYTRAAQRLSLTQPAVSHHMRQCKYSCRMRKPEREG